MGYYFNKIISGLSFEDSISKTTEVLKNRGFDVVSSVDFKETFSDKLKLEFPNYTVLGVCNAELAHKAILEEERLGLIIPCNVLIKSIDSNNVEVAIVDPTEPLSIFENKEVDNIALILQEGLISVINDI